MQAESKTSSTTSKKIPHVKKVLLTHQLKQSKPDTYDNPSIDSKLNEIQEPNTVDFIPELFRRDKLVQELEKSLAVIDNHSSDLSRIETEKTAVEMERNSLLKEIEETIFEIQSHVLNAKELELEKKVIEEECNDLREQVDHLRKVLESSNGGDICDGEDSLRALYEKANSRNQALEKEVKKLRTQNEEFLEKAHHSDIEDVSTSAIERELELLHDENSNLQKLLQMAEESEDHMAQELAECKSNFAQLQMANEMLAKEKSKLKYEKEQLELECDDLESEVEQLRVANSKLQDAKNGNALHLVSEEDRSLIEKIREELENSKDECDQLERENQAKQRKIKNLEEEVKSLRGQRPKEPQANGAVAQKGSQTVKQMKSVLEKLNKENAMLHESLEKSEKEIISLKEFLEKEKEEKKKVMTGSDKSKKSKGSKKEKEKEKDDVVSEEDRNEIESLKKERFHLRAECDALAETVAKTAKEKRKMEEEIESLIADKSQLDLSINELEKTIKDLEKVKVEKEALEQTLATQKKHYMDLNKKYEDTNQKYYEKSSELERARLDRDHMDKKYQDLHKSVDTIKEELSEAQHQMLTRTDEVKFLRQRHNEEKKVLSTSSQSDRKQKEELQEEIRIISERLEASEAERQSLESVNESQKSELQNLKRSVEELKKELEDTRRQLSEVKEAKLEAEERAELSQRSTSELQKAQAVSSDMAMEKSLELSRTKRTLEKKIEKLTRENVELKKKSELDVPSHSPRVSPVTIQMQKVPSLDVDLRAAAVRPGPRGRHDSEQYGENDVTEQNRRLVEEQVVYPTAENYVRSVPRGRRGSEQDSETVVTQQPRRVPVEQMVHPSAENYVRAVPRGRPGSGEDRETGFTEQSRRLPEEQVVRAVAENSVSSSAYHRKQVPPDYQSLFGNRNGGLLEGSSHATFSGHVNRVKVTATNEPLLIAPMAYRISQSQASEPPPPSTGHVTSNSHAYEWKKSEPMINNHWDDPEYAYQMLKERSVMDQRMHGWGDQRNLPNGTDVERHQYPVTESSDRADNSNSVFQVVGYRKGRKFIHEHYV